MDQKKLITVESIVKAPIQKVWDYWNNPEHIVHWAFASDDWEAPAAENDLRVGGKFRTVMAAKDKSAGFDFTGTYTQVKEHELIEYDMDDPPSHPPTSETTEGQSKALEGQGKRHVKVEFDNTPEGVKITTVFDPENENPEEMQRSGWQAILDNFKKHTENN
jgi:uncharacterized protein YndB with AHSA1/START domain